MVKLDELRKQLAAEFMQMNGANGMSNIEDKVTRVGASEYGRRTSFNYEI